MEIEDLLNEVADELGAPSRRHTVVMVGGSLLAWHGIRMATKDVDTVKRLEKELIAAVSEVAKRHDLAPSWLNDSAAHFMPATFDEDACETLLDRENFLVLGAPFEDVFLMKLRASRAVDYDDLVALWPRCTFASPEDAATKYQSAYPHEDPDPHLAEHIEGIAARAAELQNG